MQAKLLGLTIRHNGHYVATHRTTTGKTRVTVIPSGANLERALTELHQRLNQPQPKGK